MPFPNTITVPIAFMGGLNSKVSEFTLDQPYFQDLQNAVFNQIGQIDKRTGFTTVSTNIQGGGNISSGYAITTFNGELVLLDGTTMYSYQQEEDVWISRGTIFSTVNDQTRIINTKIATQSNPDCSSSDNITVYLWEDGRIFPANTAGVRYSVLNNKTGTIVVSDQVMYLAGTRPKVITDGYTFFCYYNAATDTILYNTIPVNHPNTVTSTFNFVCRDGYSSNPPEASIPYDVALLQGKPLVAYCSQTGVNLVYEGNTYQISTNSDLHTMGICVTSLGTIWVSWSGNNNTRVSLWQWNGAGFTQLLFPMVINQYVPELSINLALIEGNAPGSLNITNEQFLPGNNNFCNNYTVSAKGVSTFIGQMRGVGLASKPFKFGNNIFINTIAQSNLQSTYFTQCLTQGANFRSGTAIIQAANNAALATNFALVSKHSPQNGGNYRTNHLLSQCDPVGPIEVFIDGYVDGYQPGPQPISTFTFAGQRKGPFTSWQNSSTVNLGCAGYSIIFDSPNAFNNVSSNNNLHIVGGIKKIYDGVSCVEDNFNLFPENADGYGCDVTLNHGTGHLGYNPLFGTTNQYQYVVVYEWTDNYNQVQRSGPSVPITVNIPGDGYSASLVGPTLRITDKVAPRSSVIISIYRTQLDLPIFYKITDDNDPLVNDPTVDTWTFPDDNTDAQIAANENLYTGSQLGNIAPPPCSLISLYQQRLMINSNEDPGVIWYSQNKFDQTQYNTLALDWNTSFINGIDSRLGNDITAIGLVDNWLAIFKATSIFILQGDGPNALLTAGQFNDAQLLVSDTGCLDQNSLVFITQTPNSPGGVLFKSPKGIYLLGRDQSLTYVGAPVEKYNNLTITSANLLAQSNQVVFTTLEGTALVYNYYFNAWTTWENLPAIDACVWENQLVLLRPDGSCMIQDITKTIFVDTYPGNEVVPVSLLLQTPWLKIQQQGYMNVYNCFLLGTLQGPHVLQCEVAYDYNPSITGGVLINSALASPRWGSNLIWGSPGVWGETNFSNYQFQINMEQPRCQAIQLTFSDVNNPATSNVGATIGSQGFSLNGLLLEVMPHPSAMRLPVANKVGIG